MKDLKSFGLSISNLKLFRETVSKHMEKVLTEKVDGLTFELLTKEAETFFKEIEPEIIEAFSQEKSVIKKALIEEIKKAVQDRLNDVDWLNKEIRKIFGGCY